MTSVQCYRVFITYHVSNEIRYSIRNVEQKYNSILSIKINDININLNIKSVTLYHIKYDIYLRLLFSKKTI